MNAQHEQKMLAAAKVLLPDPEHYVSPLIKIKLKAYGRAVLFRRKQYQGYWKWAPEEIIPL